MQYNLGNTSLLELPPERQYEPKTGWRLTRKWRGLLADCNAFASTVAGPSVSVQVTPDDSGMGSVSVRQAEMESGSAGNNPAQTGEPEADSDVWDLDGNDLEEPVWEHKAVAAYAVLDPTDYDYLRRSYEEAKADGNWKDFIGTFNTPEGNAIWLMLTTGVESYLISQYVLRRTRAFASSSRGAFNLAGANLQYSTQQLLELGPPMHIAPKLPSGAWLKSTSKIQSGNGKTSCSEEWRHAESWLELLYPKAPGFGGGDTPAGGGAGPTITITPASGAALTFPDSTSIILSVGCTVTSSQVVRRIFMTVNGNGPTIVGSGSSISREITVSDGAAPGMNLISFYAETADGRKTPTASSTITVTIGAGP